MTALTWDNVGERRYETGVDHGVLYLPDGAGDYVDGYAWNGLTTVTESPSGAEPNPQYADNIKYLNLVSAEEFGATIEAFTYPDEFGQCDGTSEPEPGVFLGQQSRRAFGLSYRTQIGNDLDGTDHGYKLHLVYGAQAAPSEKAYATINDSPEAITFSWELTTTPVQVVDFKPTALLTIDSTKVDATALADLVEILYGTVGDDHGFRFRTKSLLWLVRVSRMSICLFWLTIRHSSRLPVSSPFPPLLVCSGRSMGSTRRTVRSPRFSRGLPSKLRPMSRRVTTLSAMTSGRSNGRRR